MDLYRFQYQSNSDAAIYRHKKSIFYTMSSASSLKNIAYSSHPIGQNLHCLDWGPNGFLGVAMENFVTIYDSNLNVFRNFNLHKSPISCIRFSPGSVERSLPNSFQYFIAVGDETGNFIVYDIYNGVRHAGFSPEKLPIIPIIDLQWNPSNPSMIFILTTAPSVMCVSVGSTSRRHYSCIESWAQIGQSIQSFNLNFVFSVYLNDMFRFMLTDQFHSNQLFVASSNAHYAIIKIQNARQITPFVSKILQFEGLPKDQKIISIEYFPHNINRLTIVMTYSIYVYDLTTKKASLIYSNDITSLSPMNNIFLASVSDRFWVAVNDGTVTSFAIKDQSYIRDAFVLIPQVHQIFYFAVNPYNPKTFAVLTYDGKIMIFTELRKKFFCSSYKPSFPDQILGICSNNKDKYAFVTDHGYIGIFNTLNDQYLRFQIEGSITKQTFINIAFLTNDPSNDENTGTLENLEKNIDNQLVIGGPRLYTIDLKTRALMIKNKHLSPLNMIVKNSIIAYTPFPSNLEIIVPGKPKTSVTFAGTIISYSVCETDSNKWVVIVRGKGMCIIDVRDKPKMISQFNINEEAVTTIVYINNDVFFGTRIGDIIKLDLEHRSTSSVNIGSSMIKGMKFFDDILFVSEQEGNTHLFDYKQFKIIKTPKSKILDASFLTKSYAISMLSPTILMITNIPSFEFYVSPATSKSDISLRFLNCKNIVEFEKAGLEAGDLEFVQFVRTIRHLGNLPLPTLYTQNHDEFVAKDHITKFVERISQPKNMIDYLILTKQNELAANSLIELSSQIANSNNLNNPGLNVGEAEILMSYACLSPNLQAINSIIEKYKNKCRHIHLISKLLVISGDLEKSLQWLIENDDWSEALYYLKMLFDDEYTNIKLKEWLSKKPILQLSPLILVFIHDYHAALSTLYKTGYVSRAYALLNYLKNNNIEVQKSIFSEFTDEAIDAIIEKIENKWSSYT